MHVVLTVWSALLSGALVVILLLREVLVLQVVHWEEARSPLDYCGPTGNEPVWSACPRWCRSIPPPPGTCSLTHKNTTCTASAKHFDKYIWELMQTKHTDLRNNCRPSFQGIWLVGSESESAGPLGTVRKRMMSLNTKKTYNQQHTVFILMNLGMINMFWNIRIWPCFIACVCVW